MKKLLTVVCLLSLFVPAAFAKASASNEGEWSHDRYGLGVNLQVNGMDAVSLRYWEHRDWGVEGIVGWNTYSPAAVSTSQSLIGGKYLRPIKTEKNATIYGFAMLAFLNTTTQATATTTTSNSGTFLAAGVGIEFFFDELPNLGIGAELGVSSQTGAAFENTGVKGTALFANAVNNIGLHYYFK